MGSVTLHSISRRPPKIGPGIHVVLSVVKNEALRLPYFLTHHRQLGFDQFIFVDNGSIDGTCEFLSEQPDTTVYYTDAPFGAPPGDALNWKNGLLDHFCDGHSVLVVDADEMFVWPGCENETVCDLETHMAEWRAEALFAPMIDMYSDRPFSQIGYRAGKPFVEYAPFFDRGPYFYKRIEECPYMDARGGVRARIWANRAVDFHSPNIAKVPFLRWRRGQRFVMAQHRLLKPFSVAPVQGALLHFKMLDDLEAKCQEWIISGQHYMGGRECHVLLDAIRQSGGNSFFDSLHSVRWTGTEQLAELKFIENNELQTM